MQVNTDLFEWVDEAINQISQQAGAQLKLLQSPHCKVSIARGTVGGLE
jgi:hypothetical protein